MIRLRFKLFFPLFGVCILPLGLGSAALAMNHDTVLCTEDILRIELGEDYNVAHKPMPLEEEAPPSISSLINFLEDDQVAIFRLPLRARSEISQEDVRENGGIHWSDFGHSAVATQKHVMSLYTRKRAGDTKVEEVSFQERAVEMSKLDYLYSKRRLQFVVLKHQDIAPINARIEELFEACKVGSLEYLNPKKVATKVTKNRVLGGITDWYANNSWVFFATGLVTALVAPPYAMTLGTVGTALGYGGVFMFDHDPSRTNPHGTQALSGQNCSTATRYVLNLYNNGHHVDYCTPDQQLKMHEASSQLVLTEETLPHLKSNKMLRQMLKESSASEVVNESRKPREYHAKVPLWYNYLYG